MPRPVVSWVRRASRSSSGSGDAAQVERPLGALGEADDDEAEAVLAGLVVLLDQAALLERGEQPRRGRLVQAEPAGELGHAGLALALAEGEQERRRAIDRADRVAVEDHRRPARSAGARVRHRAVGSGPIVAVGAGLERRVERVREDRDDPVDDVAARRAPRR